MRKLIFIFAIAFVLFVANANATCPTGWTSTSITYLYDSNSDNIPDCEVTVYYCYITLPTGEFKVKIDRITIDIDCGLNFINTTDFWDDLHERVREDFMQVVTFPPCPHGVINVEIRRVECWAVKNVPPNPLEQEPGHMELIDCGMIGFCEWYYKICWDSVLMKNVATPMGFNSMSSELCPDEMPELPPIGKTWFEEWTTECYGVTCVE